METLEVRARLLALEDLDFLIHNPPEFTETDVSLDKYNVTVRCRIHISDEDNTINIIMSFDIKALSDIKSNREADKFASVRDRLPSMHYEGMASYEVRGDVVLKPDPKTKGLSVPLSFINRLGDTSYSTFRGIIFDKCSSTVLRKVPLPLLTTQQIGEIISQVVQEAEL